MMTHTNAEIVAIGTEILLGEITDTNSVYIAQQFRDVGINLYYMTTVGDNRQRIARAIEIALERADVVITCGGLGPTVDDMTRHGVADATHRELIFSQDLLDQIAARFASYRATMSDNNRRQAYTPDGAIIVQNPVGTAPAFIVEVGDKCVISLPGVPREMKYLMQERILPYLRDTYELGIIKARLLKTAGIGESRLDEILGNELLEQTNPTVGLAAHHGVIDIRMTAKASSEEEADKMLDLVEARVRERAGTYIFGKDQDVLEDILVRFLRDQALKITIIEAGIQDAVIAKLQATGGDDIFADQRSVAHPQDLMTAEQSIREAAEQTAQSAVDNTASDASIVIFSDPDVDENADVDVATVVAVYVNQTVRSRVYGFGAQSPLARDWVSRWALSYLWRELKEKITHVD
jgi:nicotinamide-nucleotide amidase